MAEWNTGLTRDLVFNGSIAGNYRQQWDCVTPGGGGPQILVRTQNSKCTFEITWPYGPTSSHILQVIGLFDIVSNINGAGMNPPPTDTDPSVLCSVTTNTRYKRFYVEATVGMIGSEVKDVWTSFNITGPQTIRDDNFTTGSFTLAISGCELWFEDFIGSDYPDYGGDPIEDPPLNSEMVWKYKLKVGSLLTASVSAGGQSASTSHEVAAGDTAFVGAVVGNFRLEQDVWCASVASSGLMQCGVVFNNETLTADYFGSSGGDSYNAQSGAMVACVNSASMLAKVAPRRHWSLDANIRAMEAPYPGSVTLSMLQKLSASPVDIVTDDSGVATPSGMQESYDCVAMLNSVGQTSKAVNEVGPLQIWLKNSWITTAGEPEDDWRVGFKGRPYDAFTLQQSNTLDVCGTFSGAGPGPLSRSLPDAQTAAGLKGTSWQGASLAGYHYLRLRIRSVGSANRPFKVKFGSKEWERDRNGVLLTTGADNVYGEAVIDLCLPSSVTDLTDDKDTRFPYSSIGPAVVSDGTMWGVSNATSLALTDLTNGATYQVEWARVERIGYSRATFLPAWQNWIADGAGSDYRIGFLLGETDGRVSLEGIDYTRTPGMPTIYTIRSLTSLIGSVNGAADAWPTDGWSATAASSFPDGYHTNTLPACFAWGGGMLYRAAKWEYGFDKDAASALTVRAQPIWDSVSLLPGLGDAFGFDASYSGSTLLLRAGKILRGQATGLVFYQNRKTRWQGAKALLLEVGTPDIEAGDGQANFQGSYQTNDPFGKGEKNHKVKLKSGDGSVPAVNISPLKTRKRHRACFRGQPICCDTMFCSDSYFFPFAPQWSDPNLLPLEEWRRFPGVQEERPQGSEAERELVER